MVTYGFYDSINYDRRYNAEQMSQIFDGIINEGVYMSIGDTFKVEGATSGLAVIVGSGRAWFNHTWTLNDAAITLNLDTAPTYGSRIDAIVLEIDRDSRTNSIKVIKGTAASSPSRPTLIVGDNFAQRPLAYITIGTDASSITGSMITNMVGTSSCPFVTGIIDTISADRLIANWESDWQDTYKTWSSEMQNLYDNWSTKLLLFTNEIADDEFAIKELDEKITFESNKLSTKLSNIEQQQRTDFDNYMTSVKSDFNSLYIQSVSNYNKLQTDTSTTLTSMETSTQKQVDDYIDDAQKQIDSLIVDTDALIEIPVNDILEMWED